MRVEIVIERMSVNGIAVGSRRRLGEALRRELERLVLDGGVPEALARDARVPHASTHVPMPTTPHADASLGRRLAGRVYRSLRHLDRPHVPPPAAANAPSKNR